MENKNTDILGSLETLETSEIITPEVKTEEVEDIFSEMEAELESAVEMKTETIEEKKEVTTEKKGSKVLSSAFFAVKYVSTSALIFALLLVTTNYSAYYNLAMSYIFQDEMANTNQSLITAVEASNITETFREDIIKKKEIVEEQKEEKDSEYSIKNLIEEDNARGMDLDIEITPYQNRIVIPKIGKNIPLVDIMNQEVEWGGKELENIFMKELENGVIRYPGSAKPGNDGNTFIFGHSSNFPWIKGDYNDVFALLDHVENGDEIIIYYNQKKFKYKINRKDVVTPGDVSVLEWRDDKKELSLMTCWPIGTTLNRLIVTGELVEEL